jgi:hypothetical protein
MRSLYSEGKDEDLCLAPCGISLGDSLAVDTYKVMHIEGTEVYY